MAAVYPAALATTTDLPDAGANLSTNPHSSLHNKNRDEIVAIEAELGVAPSGSYSTLRAREDAGWQPILSGSPAAATSFTVTIPASTYSWVRVAIWGVGSVLDSFRCRVNNDSTAAFHRYAYMQAISSAVSTATLTSTSWLIGNMDTGTRNTITLDVFGGDAPSEITYQSTAVVHNATESNCRHLISGGNIASTSTTLTSLVFFPNSGTFTGRYIAEGHP